MALGDLVETMVDMILGFGLGVSAISDHKSLQQRKAAIGIWSSVEFG
jgi:hypothetical protein